MNHFTINKNPNQTAFKEISKAVQENDGYCCCALEHTDDTKCICTEFRNSTHSGECHCGRYYKVQDHEIITLCGSTKFKLEFELLNKTLTLMGAIVLAPGCFGHVDSDPKIEENKEALDNLHFDKIAISDAIFVVNIGGYIGESTEREIEWAKYLNKKIYYLEEKE